MLIERQVLVTLKSKHPEMQYKHHQSRDSLTNPAMFDNFYTFFDTMVEPVTKEYLSEDYAFCKRVQNAGYDVWMDLYTNLSHTGQVTFSGCPYESLPGVDDQMYQMYQELSGVTRQ